MKVNLIKEQTLRDFMQGHARSRSGLTHWLQLIQVADWERPDDMGRLFPSADLLGNGSNRVVFDIGGNKYRLICKYYFSDVRVTLFVKWIGSHAAYDRLCHNREQYEITMF